MKSYYATLSDGRTLGAEGETEAEAREILESFAKELGFSIVSFKEADPKEPVTVSEPAPNNSRVFWITPDGAPYVLDSLGEEETEK